jgi:hypothetical protein
MPYVTNTDFTRPEQVRNVIEGLDKHRVRDILWPVGLDVPVEPDSGGDHLTPLRAYLRNYYHVIQTFPDAGQVWGRDH